jgi:nucleobase:cation symporter-1, NCS1 family
MRTACAPIRTLYNADLAPTTPEQRTWSTYNYIALWFSMSMGVTTYMLASSLIAGGMNCKQAIAPSCWAISSSWFPCS